MLANLRKAIRGIGLSDNETLVLGTLLERGALPASRIAKESGLNRTTTYGVIKELSGKGLVSTAQKSGVAKYQSIPPALLPSYVARRRDELSKYESDIAAAVPQLEALRSQSLTLPKVQFFEGVAGLKQAYEDTLESNKEKKLRDITGVAGVYKALGKEWLEYYLGKRKRLGISCVDIAPETTWAKESKKDDDKYLRTTKFLPKESEFDAEISIYDNKVGIFSYAERGPMAVLIEDPTIASAMKKIFEHLERTSR